MFRCKRVIRLRDTDATGVLFFSEQPRIALEVFEEFLRSCNFSLRDLLKKKEFLIPIVHVEADYFSPLFVDDEIEVELTLKKTGISSFTLHYRFFDVIEKKDKGSVSIVHVATSKKMWKAIPLPNDLLQCLEKLVLRHN